MARLEVAHLASAYDAQTRRASSFPPPEKTASVRMTPAPHLAEDFGSLHRVGLLFRHVANHGQLVHLPLIRLEQQYDPDDEAGEPNQRPDEDRQPAQEWYVRNEAEHDP